MSHAIGQFTLTRQIAASPSVLWYILTDADERELWGAPSDEHVLDVDFANVVEGGSDRHRCGPKENPEFIVDTHWYVLNGPISAVVTERLHGGSGDWSLSLVGYELTEEDSGTALKIDVSVLSLEGPEMIEEHKSGWTSALARMEAMIVKGKLPATRT